MSSYGHFDGTCGHAGCSGLVTLSPDHHRAAKETGELFYCSFGHVGRFAITEVDRLRDEVARLKADAAAAWDTGWQDATSQLLPFAYCPFARYGACHQATHGGSYTYATPEQLARHLATMHGVDGLWAELRAARAEARA